MGVRTIKTSDGTWPDLAAVETGHYAVYYPSSRVLALLDRNGNKVAETGVPGGVLKFSAYIDRATGEIVVPFADWNNDSKPWPWKEWTTGAFVGTTAPSPPAGPAAELVAGIKAKLAELSALVNQL